MSSSPSTTHRLRRLGPVAALAVVALVTGAKLGASYGDEDRALAATYMAAWERGDYGTMHELLTPEAQRRYSRDRFAALHGRAAQTTTLQRLRSLPQFELTDDGVATTVAVRTYAFGQIRAQMTLPLEAVDGRARVAWAAHLVFPGLRPGEKLSRETTLPERAGLRSREGTVLASGPERTGGPAETTGIVGTLGTAPEERRAELMALGVPPDASVGVSGLELIFDRRLLGVPGGKLSAGSRVLAETEPRAAADVRTSIDVDVQRAARAAIGDRVGGVAVVQPATGQILAASGIALDGLQPPGSTFKIITLAAALEAGVVKPTDTFPAQTGTTLSGVALQNNQGESCGGSLSMAFAESCNSVFAPLGAKAGGPALVSTAEEFGFNAPVGIPGAATSTIPPGNEIGDDLAVGSTAIGQGRVQATALMMAWVAAVVAERGERPALTFDLEGQPTRKRVMRAEVAETVARAMRAVVTRGTGVAAHINGVSVAGKTGTAELRRTQGCDEAPVPTQVAGQTTPSPSECSDANDITDTTAWFSAFAPLNASRVAVGVVLPAGGTGGQNAAPVARQVIMAALKDGPPAATRLNR